MAITWYTTQGIPSDSVGVAGDLAWDTTNRITWGPKTTTWVGTGYSNIGPTGPAMLAGSGAPASTYGQIGNGYVDATTGNLYLKSSSGWSLTGSVSVGNSPVLQGAGPPNATTAPTVLAGQLYLDTTNSLLYPPSTSASYTGFTGAPISVVGPTGPTMQVQPVLGQYNAGCGPAAFCSGFASTATAQSIFVNGSNALVSTFVPTTASAFISAQITNYSNSSGSLQVQLYNVTTSTVVWTSPSYTKGTVNNAGVFANTAYPLTAGNQYVWQVIGAQTAYIYIQPYYLFPANSVGSNVTFAGAAFTPTNLALSTTAQPLQPPQALTGLTWYWSNPKASYLYSATIQVSGTGTATFTFGTSGGTLITTAALTAGTYNIGPYAVGAAYVSSGTSAFWQVTGTGTITAVITPSFCF